MSPDTWLAASRRAPRWVGGEPAPFALDNGAWGAHQRAEAWDEGLFVETHAALGAQADWTVLPDIVAGGRDSLRLSESWVPRLPGRVLLAVQDGMCVEDVRPLLSERVGIFVGGSTEWKIQTLAAWGRLGAEVGAWVHVGRVNTARRIALCGAAGAHSFDGTSVTRFAKTIHNLDAARHRYTLFHQEGPWKIAA